MVLPGKQFVVSTHYKCHRKRRIECLFLRSMKLSTFVYFKINYSLVLLSRRQCRKHLVSGPGSPNSSRPVVHENDLKDFFLNTRAPFQEILIDLFWAWSWHCHFFPQLFSVAARIENHCPMPTASPLPQTHTFPLVSQAAVNCWELMKGKLPLSLSISFSPLWFAISLFFCKNISLKNYSRQVTQRGKK